jgi:hypothetical protein
MVKKAELYRIKDIENVTDILDLQGNGAGTEAKHL